MKKILISLAFAAAAAVSAFGQIGVGVGYMNKNELTATKGGSSSNIDYGGFYAGVDYTLPISGAFSVTPGVVLSFPAHKEELLGVSSTTSETYLDVPVMFNYGFKLAGIIGIYPYAGPTLSLGLASKTKTGSYSVDNYKESDYNRFDLMIGGGVALVLTDMVRVSVGYNYGLLDLNKSELLTIHNNGIHFGVAYLF